MSSEPKSIWLEGCMSLIQPYCLCTEWSRGQCRPVHVLLFTKLLLVEGTHSSGPHHLKTKRTKHSSLIVGLSGWTSG